MSERFSAGDRLRIEPADNLDSFAESVAGQVCEFVNYRQNPAGWEYAMVRIEGWKQPQAVRLKDLKRAEP